MSPLLIGAGMAAGNTALNAIGIGQQTGASEDLMKYQWDNFMSPRAQVREMAAAGLNPGAVLGSGKGSFASPSVGMPSVAPVQIGGVDTLANYLVAKSQAKRNEVDTKLLDIEAQNKQFELDLNRCFSSKERVANLLSAYKALQLQDDEHSRNEWLIAKEKALSELSGIQKDTAKKVLDNMDTQIMQENKQREESIKLTKEQQKTEKSSQSANYASAQNQRAQALLNKEIQSIKHVEREVAETGKLDQIDALLADYRRDKMLSDEEYEEAKKRFDALKRINKAIDKSEFVSKTNAAFTWLTDILGAPFKGLTSNLGK